MALDLGSYIVYIIEALLDMLAVLVVDLVIPMIQSFIPGSDNTIWDPVMYPLLIILIILIAIWIVIEKIPMS